MAIAFPASPTLNETYTYNGRTWYWDGSGWSIYQPGLQFLDVVTALNYTPLPVNDGVAANLNCDSITINVVTANGSNGAQGLTLMSDGTTTSWQNPPGAYIAF